MLGLHVRAIVDSQASIHVYVNDDANVRI